MNTSKLQTAFCLLFSSIIGFLLLGGTAQAQPNDDDQKQTDIKFASNKDAPFLTYSTQGGRLARPTQGVKKPRLQIWPTGKLVCATVSSVTFEAELSEKEVKRIATELVNDKKIYDLSADSIQKEVETAGQKTYFQNVTSSHIEINLQRGKHVLDIVGSEITMQKFPDLKEMKRAKEIERFLERVIAKAMVGGQREEKKVLKKINEALKEQHAKKYKPFEFDDVKFATRIKEGRTQLTFERIVEDKETKASSRLVGRYTKKADGKESASISIWGIPDFQKPRKRKDE